MDLRDKELDINLQVKVDNDKLLVMFEDITPRFNIKYMVDDYYIIIVKNEKKMLFNIALADNLYYTDKLSPVTIKHKSHNIQQIDMIDSRDSDGESLGGEYVVFVYAKYSETYKDKINNYENFLSDPSESFIISV